MANRTRTVRIHFNVTKEEKELIEKKMHEVGTDNMGAYLRKMAIDGYIVIKDFGDLKSNTAELNKIGVNINQLVKRMHQSGNIYDEDIREIKRKLDNIWQLQKSTLSKVL